MRCPQCGDRDTRVVDSRDLDDSATIRRRRECTACSTRFTTYERIEAARLVVVKRDGVRQEFDREKLVTGLRKALTRRPVPDDAAEVAGDRIEAELRAEGMTEVDPEAVHLARARIEHALAHALRESLLARDAALAAIDARSADAGARALRRLRNACLAALCRVDAQPAARARAHYAGAGNLGDRLAALRVLVELGGDDAEAPLAHFAAAHAREPLLLDKWFTLQATDPHPRALARVQALAGHARFRWSNPNNVHALVGAFATRNPRAFHRADGDGYRFVADAVLRVDALTPQVAARVATAFAGWRRYRADLRALMQAELERIAARPAISPDLADIVARCLA